jgi:DnaA-homolog protein
MKQIALDIGLEAPPTLANFCVAPASAANLLALAHMQDWLAGSAEMPAPIYLWGEQASGKTHLLRAAYHVLQAQSPQGANAVGWLDASVIDPPPFNPAWTALLLDDVHLYSAGQQTAAFNWFVQLQGTEQAQVKGVLAAGRLPPADLPLREDLRTRLGWGHVFALDVLSEPQRRAVLRQAADARGLFLSDEVMDFMLTRFSRDLGSLMHMLAALDAYALRTQRALTIPLIRSMLEDE